MNVTALSTSRHERDERDRRTTCIVTAPPSRPTSIREQRQQRRHQQRGDHARRHEEAHRVEAHRRERVDLLVDAHRADLGGERGARAPGEQDRRHQRAELAQHRRGRSGRRRRSRRRTASSAPPTGTRGSCRAGTRSARRSAARPRRRARRCARRRASARSRMPDARRRAPPVSSPTNATCSRSPPGRVRGRADLLDRRAAASARDRGRARCAADRTARRSASKAGRGCATSTGAARGWRNRSTKQRDAGAVAVVDPRRIDDHRPRRRLGDGAVGVAHSVGTRLASSLPDSASDASPVGQVGDRERCRGHGVRARDQLELRAGHAHAVALAKRRLVADRHRRACRRVHLDRQSQRGRWILVRAPGVACAAGGAEHHHALVLELGADLVSAPSRDPAGRRSRRRPCPARRCRAASTSPSRVDWRMSAIMPQLSHRSGDGAGLGADASASATAPAIATDRARRDHSGTVLR